MIVDLLCHYEMTGQKDMAISADLLKFYVIYEWNTDPNEGILTGQQRKKAPAGRRRRSTSRS